VAKSFKSILHSVLSAFMKNRVYTSRTGLAAGLKRRGGFGFLPVKKTLTREHTFLKSLNFKGKTVYDVGGHIGLMTMFFAREAGETGTVVTFEPNPQNYAAILDHIKLNGFANIRVLQIGLGSKNEVLAFVIADSARGTASPEKQKQYQQKDVQVTQIEVDTLDSQIARHNLPKPDFIKIDVEGLELDVLRGMTQTISNYRPEIFIELHGVSEWEVVKLLLSHDYKVHQVEDGIEINQQNIERVHGHLYATPQFPG
jgi:FkbM family methyltransferase